MNASRCDDTRPTGAGRPWRVAILPWGNLIEDFLDPLGVSLDDFARNMSGGWLFGYAAALRTAGMEPVIVCGLGRVHRAGGGALGLIQSIVYWHALIVPPTLIRMLSHGPSRQA